MIINSIKLNNIRSYTDAEIKFPEGTTLLSGDIGSGKSTVLLAIEFALFGIIRGGLAGNSLLRHGQTNGNVELKTKIAGKEVTIFRTLKRSKDSVTQDSGYLIVNNEKTEGTPVELKAKILAMIGYPDELVAKSKSLLYRYTVYTPQEQMKEILFEQDENRLDTLRRIFNIDKYKRIKENSAILSRELRTEKKLIASRLEGMLDLENKLKEKQVKQVDVETNLEKLEVKLDQMREKVDKNRKQVKKIEDENKERTEIEKDLAITSLSIKEKKERILEIKNEQENLISQINFIKAELKDSDENKFALIQTKIKKAEESITAVEDKLSEVREKEAILNSKRKSSEEIIENINKLENANI